MKIKIKFFSDEMLIDLPNNYTQFLKTLVPMIQMELEKVKQLKFSYTDSEGDTIEFSSDQDFEELYKQVQRKEVDTISVDIDHFSQIFSQTTTNKMQNEVNPPIQNINSGNLQEINDFPKNPNQPMNNREEENNPQIYRAPLQPQNDQISNQSNRLKFQNICNICNETPIYDILYFCPRCGFFSCHNCEEKLNMHDNHAIFKIRTMEKYKDALSIYYHLKNYSQQAQYPYAESMHQKYPVHPMGGSLMYNNQQNGMQQNNLPNQQASQGEVSFFNKMNQYIKSWWYPNEQNPNTILNPNPNMNMNMNMNVDPRTFQGNLNNSNINVIYPLIVEAKKKYLLNTYTDEQIGNAICQAYGNIDLAVKLLK